MYSIWIIPPEPLYSQLKTVITTLANKYHGPIFEPHITIVGNIERDLSDVESAARQVARKLGGLRLYLGQTSFSTTYFQSVFVRIQSSAGLMQLNLDLKELCGKPNDVFMPHISLLYGDHDMKTRDKAQVDAFLPTTSWVASKLTIVPANDDPDTWKHLSSIPFSSH